MLPLVLKSLLHTQDAMNEAKHSFYVAAGFPRVRLAIYTCAFSPLQTPSIRRGIPNANILNLQTVCDSNAIITNVKAKYPGMIHN